MRSPWFLMLAAEYVRWTGDVAFFHQLRDNINRALDWMDENEKEHSHGFLTYGTKSEKGLINQGWKDSDNGIVNEDGSLVEPPVALVEVQGYAYRARRDIADILRMIGDEDSAQTLEQKAEALKQRFNETFWMDDAGFYGFALQRGGRLSRAIASNPGQTLFTGIVTEERARKVADRLMQDDLFCGWGIRTLSEQEVAYNPLDYQVGSVWPHDNALIALGMRRWGETEHLDRLFTGIYEAATQFTDFRLPEVFDGFSLSQYTRPVKYPVACSPQAWAAGALPLLLQSALGLQPHAMRKMLYIYRPHLPQWLGDVTVRSLRCSREGDTTLVAVLKREGDVMVQVEY
ncbi:MAG TPA: amylo-alpha-1,6-glucosidase [Ktedonobacterales bacterium]